MAPLFHAFLPVSGEKRAKSPHLSQIVLIVWVKNYSGRVNSYDTESDTSSLLAEAKIRSRIEAF